jgi:hypothetical protein
MASRTNKNMVAVAVCLALVLLSVGSADSKKPETKPANTSPLSAGTATSVVFLCDGSGTMLHRIGPLREHLKSSIRSLSPTQRFDIAVFADDRVMCFKYHLVAATDRNVAEALLYIDRAVVARGETHPAIGVRRALAEKPALIVLRTDGIFQDEDVDDIRVANLTTRTPIDVVQYVGPQEDYQPGEKLARHRGAERRAIQHRRDSQVEPVTSTMGITMVKMIRTRQAGSGEECVAAA